jgi:uncharacterized spore protein YtfJ
MNAQQLLESMAERVSARASVKSVYGDPLIVGDRTVIPIAQVRYGFGGGAGRRKGDDEAGGGGGGSVSARPSGALEITPKGTRFIAFDDRWATGIVLALGFALGAIVVGLSGQRQAEVARGRN